MYNCYISHDGTPAHFARGCQPILNHKFNKWIGRGGPVPWPERSPDLTPLDFFHGSYIKAK